VYTTNYDNKISYNNTRASTVRRRLRNSVMRRRRRGAPLVLDDVYDIVSIGTHAHNERREPGRVCRTRGYVILYLRSGFFPSLSVSVSLYIYIYIYLKNSRSRYYRRVSRGHFGDFFLRISYSPSAFIIIIILFLFFLCFRLARTTFPPRKNVMTAGKLFWKTPVFFFFRKKFRKRPIVWDRWNPINI